MGRYLKIAGIIEIVGTVIGIIVEFIYMIAISIGASWALGIINGFGVKTVSGIIIFLGWVVFIATSIFAPANGIGLYTIGDFLENPNLYVPRPNNTSRDKKLQLLEEQVTALKGRVTLLESQKEKQKKTSD